MVILSSRQATRDLDGQRTEILLQPFADRILVIVTQVGKVGNLIQATIPATSPLPSAPPPDTPSSGVQLLPTPPAAIQMTPLLGSASSEHMETLHSLYAAQIATILWIAESEGTLEAQRRGVIVGIALCKSHGNHGGLTESERVTFEGVMSILRELIQK